MKLGVKVIHCSERDTQITDQPKQVDEFVNTWSIEGLREEGITTAEMGWGTHEKQLPPAGLPSSRRAAQPNLPGADGHQHLGRLLGAALLHPRHDHPPRRGLHHLRPADRLGRRPADLPAHGPLRLLPLRLLRSSRWRSCAAATTTCSRTCGSCATRSSAGPTSSARC